MLLLLTLYAIVKLCVTFAIIEREFNRHMPAQPKKWTCGEIGDFDRAQAFLRWGHTYLDRDGDGIACEGLKK